MNVDRSVIQQLKANTAGLVGPFRVGSFERVSLNSFRAARLFACHGPPLLDASSKAFRERELLGWGEELWEQSTPSPCVQEHNSPGRVRWCKGGEVFRDGDVGQCKLRNSLVCRTVSKETLVSSHLCR